ncbi:DUF1033 family protein [Enterococcus sp. DIV0876]|uniref:DUF1033 family protein n=1 Tax=Enterococcus sp. DIV0876 TaxID=2774633 RepID=UPI003D2FE275
MYQVVVMYGDNEPWWFFEGWQSDIQEAFTFATFNEAKSFYENKWQEIRSDYSYINAKSNFMTAFWNEEDERWCEECDDYLQQYIGIALLKEYQQVVDESEKDFYETTNSSGKTKRCQRPQQSVGL